MSAKVVNFLIEFKRIITEGRGLDFIPRLKNNETILDLGLTVANVKSIILSLTVINYSSGPKADKEGNGDIWVFGHHIGEKEIYIKLKMAQVGIKKIAKCISFHVAEFPLRYPYRRM